MSARSKTIPGTDSLAKDSVVQRFRSIVAERAEQATGPLSTVDLWQIWGQKKSAELMDDFEAWPFDKVTVVICCKNKSKDLELVLPALHNQVVLAHRWVLCDDHSDDDSISVFRKFCCEHGIEFDVAQPLSRRHFQLNTLRNLGFERAYDGLVIVIDADLIVGPGFVQAHLDLHRKATRPASSVGPLFEAFDQTGLGPINFMWGHEGWAHVSHSSTGRVPTWATVLGGNLGLHKRTWVRVGRFDPRYNGNYGADDQDLHFRLHLSGVVHVGAFNAYAIHLPHETAAGGERRGDVNQAKFAEKYGLSVYQARHVPNQIDWLGWRRGPWNKVAALLISGDAAATEKRGNTVPDGMTAQRVAEYERELAIIKNSRIFQILRTYVRLHDHKILGSPIRYLKRLKRSRS